MAKEKGGSGSSVSHNNLVKDSIVSGNVQSITDIRVDGTINGDLRCQAKVVIGSLGVINGNVFCQNALIEGKVTGNIECKQMLDIRATAQIEGNLESAKLVLEDGAYFNGTCKMNSSDVSKKTA